MPSEVSGIRLVGAALRLLFDMLKRQPRPWVITGVAIQAELSVSRDSGRFKVVGHATLPRPWHAATMR